MKQKIIYILLAGLFLAAVIYFFQSRHAFKNPYLEAYRQQDWKTIADSFVGYHYVNDAVINEKGEFATFTRPDTALLEPGLNCSGLVLSASRYLFNKNFRVRQTIKDYNKNSGKTALLGEDWDFGWDLFYNISRGHRRAVFASEFKRLDPDKIKIENFRGHSVYDWEWWQGLFTELNPAAVYLVVFNGFNPRLDDQLQYYHVAMMFRSGEEILLYSASRNNPNKGVDLHYLMRRGDLEQLIGQAEKYLDVHVIVMEIFPH